MGLAAQDLPHQGTLEARLRQQAAVAELGRLALSGVEPDVLFAEATAQAASSLGVEFSKVLELLPSGDFLLRAGVGWHPGLVGTAHVAGGADSQAGYTLQSLGPVIVEDLTTEARFSGPPLLTTHAVRSGISVLISGRERPFGVLGVHTARRRTFTSHDVNFVEAVANLLAAAIERSQAEKERGNLLAEAQRLLRLRDEFLAVASHELRTPLTPLLLQLQALKRSLERHEERDDRDLALRLDAAARQVKRLSRLVDGLLDVTRLGEGGLKLSRERTDLADVAGEVVARFQEEASAQSSPITLVANAHPIGDWDRLRLEQVLTNLLSNATKYGAHHPIEVTVSSSEGSAWLRVTDHGVGIAPEDLERIFGRFERAVSARAYGGLGLGLYITRKIVEAHGGKVCAESMPHVGTTFTVELPLTSPAKDRD